MKWNNLYLISTSATILDYNILPSRVHLQPEFMTSVYQ